ncbi:GtrA family protein [Desulfotomaculum copahuensis]|uniref:GtrA/DPMS transmembrane domain-containing protein n=1 Tax=Desulfotomaculum copahuensis TaxID=1838280 RepID=A0A1B7LBP6_9FIRM|nr:GtrA family protein [Desulfotomaculum copahuensis]OAT79903.1 hypothetical protein A6M21_14420 [Desulfotomaculum copahuensis]
MGINFFRRRFQIVKQLLTFGLAGLFSTAGQIGTLVLLVELCAWRPLPASMLGFVVSLLISYSLNYRFTFNMRGSAHTAYFPRYAAVCLAGLALNSGIMYITVQLLHWWYVAGQLCTITIVPLSNFILNKYWTFKVSGVSQIPALKLAEQLQPAAGPGNAGENTASHSLSHGND